MTRALLASNRYQIDRAIGMILALKKRKVGMLGISFKAGTDDLRESPLVTVAEACIGKGLDIRIFDSEVSVARLVGANKDYIEREIPHIASLLGDFDAVVAHADVLVVGKSSPELSSRLPEHARPGQVVIDLAGVPGLSDLPGVTYRGIVW